MPFVSSRKITFWASPNLVLSLSHSREPIFMIMIHRLIYFTMPCGHRYIDENLDCFSLRCQCIFSATDTNKKKQVRPDGHARSQRPNRIHFRPKMPRNEIRHVVYNLMEISWHKTDTKQITLAHVLHRIFPVSPPPPPKTSFDSLCEGTWTCEHVILVVFGFVSSIRCRREKKLTQSHTHSHAKRSETSRYGLVIWHRTSDGK